MTRRAKGAAATPPLSPAFRQVLEQMSSLDQNYFVEPSARLALPYNIRAFALHCRLAELGKMVHRSRLLIVNFATEGGVVVEGQTIRLRPGYALLIAPNQFHDYVVTGKDRQVLWLFINFECPPQAGGDSPRHHPVPVSPLCQGFLEALVTLYATGGGRRQVAPFMNQVCLLLALILEHLHETAQLASTVRPAVVFQQGPVQPYHLLQRASEYIVTHLAGALRICDVAKALGVSGGHLRNVFHERLGMGLGEYMKYVRLQRAITLMDTTDRSLSEIATAAGYGSLSAFSRAFSKNKGLPPGAYRLRYARRSARAVPAPPAPGR